MSTRRFAIPDIHGCAKTFVTLMHDVLGVQKTDKVYLLGDYTDRGPGSKEVIDYLFQLLDRGFSVEPIRGNHEEMLLRACGNLDFFRVWMLNGGGATLKSFNVEDPCEIPLNYRRFFDALPYYRELEDYILVHAGLNFTENAPFEDTEAMLWSRTREINPEIIGGKTIITGHTPVSKEAIKRSLSSGLISLDNGCVYSSSAELGSLTALDLDTLSLYFQKNID